MLKRNPITYYNCLILKRQTKFKRIIWILNLQEKYCIAPIQKQRIYGSSFQRANKQTKRQRRCNSVKRR